MPHVTFRAYPLKTVAMHKEQRADRHIDSVLLPRVRRYPSAVHTVVVCPSVRPSVCLSQTGTVPKQLNVGEIPTESPLMEAR